MCLKSTSFILLQLAVLPLVSAQNLERAEVEKPKYKVVGQVEKIELRRYESYIVAEVTIDDDENSAMTRGFRPLADYIFGANVAQDEVEMTSPVLQQSSKSEEIAMTSPVLQSATAATESAGTGPQTIQFIMPSQYTLETLPKPNNPEVGIKKVTGYTVGVIAFSGTGGMNDMHEKESQLRGTLERHNIRTTGTAMYARYDPPWTPAAERLNEVMIPVNKNDLDTKKDE
jgi:hypothetical protein